MENIKTVKDYIVSFALMNGKILFKDDDRDATKLVEDLLDEWRLNEDFNITAFKINGHAYGESPKGEYCDRFHITIIYKTGLEAPMCVFVEEVPSFCPPFNIKK